MATMEYEPLSDSFHWVSFAPNADQSSYTWKEKSRIVLHCEKWFSHYPNMEMIAGQKCRHINPQIAFEVKGLIPERKYDMFLSLSIVAGTRFKYLNGEFVPSEEPADDYTRIEIPIENAKSGAEWMADVNMCKGFKIAREKCDESIDNKCFHVKMGNKYMPALTIREHENPQTAAYFLLPAAMFYTVSTFKSPSIGSWKKRCTMEKFVNESYKLKLQTEKALEEAQNAYKRYMVYMDNLMAEFLVDSITTSQNPQSMSIASQHDFASLLSSPSFVTEALSFLSNTIAPLSSVSFPSPPTEESSHNVPSSSGFSM